MGSPDVDVFVSGAGPAGLATAAVLSRHGLRVQVAGKAESEHAGSGLTLWPNAVQALRELGLTGVLDRGTPLVGMQISDVRGRRLTGISDQTFRSRFGDPGYVLTRAALVDGLRAGVPNGGPHDQQATVVEDDPLVAMEPRPGGGYACHTRSRTVHARAVIGADGVHSVVRRHLRPDEPPPRDLSLRVVRGLADLDVRPHPADLLMGTSTSFGIFAMAGSTYWFAAFPTEARPVDVRQRLRHHLAGYPALVFDLVEATPDRALIVNDAFDRPPLLRGWGRDLVTLVGDAAHPVAPTLGQGGCHALEDAAVLGRLASRPLDPALLRDYEHARQARVAQMTRTAHSAAVTGRGAPGWTTPVRDQLLRLAPARLLLAQLDAQFAFAGPPRRPPRHAGPARVPPAARAATRTSGPRPAPADRASAPD